MARPYLHRRPLSFAIGAVAIVVLAAMATTTGIADLPFYTKGEPREAMVVWEMAHDGSLVLPYRNGTEIPAKPPFFHWLALLAASATGGVSELSARLPSALLSIVAALAVYAFGAWTGRLRSGWLAAASLVLSFEWLRAARIARVDMTLTFFLTGALLVFAIMDRVGVTRSRLIAFYACIAAATLGKGPVGIALPALVVLAYAALRPPRDPAPRVGEPAPPGTIGWRARLHSVLSTIRAMAPLPGVAAVLAVTGAWYAAALWIGGDDFFVKQVLKENVFRVIDPERLDTGHVHGPLYFLPNFLLGALPWSLLAPAVGWWLWRARPLDATSRYLVVWFISVIALFSAASSKRSVYILPAYPAAALLLGRVLGPGPEGEGPRRLAGLGLVLGAWAVVVLAAAGFVLALGLPITPLIGGWLAPDDAQGLAAAAGALVEQRWLAIASSLIAIAGGAVAIRSAPGAHWLRGSVGLTVALLALYGGITGPVERGIASSRTLRPFLQAVRERYGDATLGFLCTFDYGAVFYSQRYFPPSSDPPRCDAASPAASRCRDHVVELLSREACSSPGARAGALRAPGTPRFILVWEDEVEEVLPEVEVLMASEGTGPKGRSRMLLVTPRTPESAPHQEPAQGGHGEPGGMDAGGGARL
jgi:4-amino-4-deoxy-L-arabinose transferase-like glycosyltransferase